jgi:hypothetical protein
MTGAVLGAALLLSANAAPAADDWRITTAGYGPVKIGMSVAEAAAALGVKLVSEEGKSGSESTYAAFTVNFTPIASNSLQIVS